MSGTNVYRRKGRIIDIELYNQAKEHCVSYEQLRQGYKGKPGKTDLEIIESFIGAFGDDPYCNINNKDAVYFENTDFTYCIRGKKKLKKYGRKVEEQGITDLSALAIINEWL